MLCRSVNSLLFSSLSRKVHNIQTAAYLNKSVRPHEPVMAEEVLSYLSPRSGEIYLDMTSGGMGHSQLILDAAPNVTVLCLDRDPVAHEMAVETSKNYRKGTVIPLLGRFSELPELLKQQKIHQHSIDGILFDFGCSSMQFDEGGRGFSISKNGPLDMRMDGDRCPNSPTCADVLAKIDEHDLAQIIKVYGEEKYAKKIARTIIEARHSFKKLETTKELADIVAAACSSGSDDHRLDKLQRPSHIATKTFQALRIFLNNELNEINYGMLVAQKYLKLGGRMVTITFHSLEDTIVKRHLMGNVANDVPNQTPLKYISQSICHDKEMMDSFLQSPWKQINKHVLTPRNEEIERNPRSRSAKLRAAIKISC